MQHCKNELVSSDGDFFQGAYKKYKFQSTFRLFVCTLEGMKMIIQFRYFEVVVLIDSQ